MLSTLQKKKRVNDIINNRLVFKLECILVDGNRL